METEGLLPFLLKAASGPHPKPDEFSPHHIYLRSNLILLSDPHLGLSTGLFT
jgi:hypothetical protein